MLTGATCAFSLPGLSDPPSKPVLPPGISHSTPAQKVSVAGDFGRLPLSFESNQGQTDTKVRFLTHSGDSTLFLTPSEAVFSMTAQLESQQKGKSALLDGRKNGKRPANITRVALRMQLVGSDPKASALTQQPLAGRVNYFLGKDPSKWHSGVPTFGRVGFHQVYSGIDLVYYGNQRHLEYDFVVAPHADPRQIKLHFAGAQGVHVNGAGDLLVRTRGRELTWQKPTVYQQDATGKHCVAVRFRLKRLPNGQAGVSFALGRYNRARPLVIDPVLIYSTFLGGSGSPPYGASAKGIAIDSAGNAYITGSTAPNGFPTTVGAFQPVSPAQNPSTSNAFVTKLNATGTAVIYSTYLGGRSGFGDGGFDIAVDGSGNAYIAGATSSSDFPTTLGAAQPKLNSQYSNAYNVFVTKLNATGSALLYSTYLGGSGVFFPTVIGDTPTGLALDSAGNAYITGNTPSADFPTTPGAFQRVNSAPLVYSTSAFVTKINSTGTAFLYSTFLGGSRGDMAAGIAVDNGGSAYVVGSAYSLDFPTTPGVFLPAHGVNSIGTYTAFITKFNSTGTALLYSTLLGGTTVYGEDLGWGIAIDSVGNAYVTGETISPDFPTTPGAFQRVRPATTYPTPNAFVAKINPDATALLYATYLGGTGFTGDIPTGIALDSSGNAYIAGNTDSPNFPTTVGAFQRVRKLTSNSSGFITKLNSTGSALLYSTYLEGGNHDEVNGIAVDSSGSAYVVGRTYSLDFPATPGAYQSVNQFGNGAPNAFVTKLSAIPVFPDFNNDGFTDLLLQNSATGEIASWFLQGATWVGGAYCPLTPPLAYTVLGTGDFRGDGATTLVLQSSITNQIALWYTTGANLATISGGDYTSVTPPAGWKVVGIGDFNGDGKSDLVFQNQTSGQIAIWFMNGYLYSGGVLLPVTPLAGWNVVGTGDFNSDGFTDLVFQNQTTGQIALWYMNGTTYVGGTVLTTVPAPGWKVVGVGDYNGDGSADLLFQNQTSNQAAVWYLQNGAFAGGDVLSLAPPAGWKIVGPR
jgi:hypothetical protein